MTRTMKQKRISDVASLSLGSVVHDVKNMPWVFIGYWRRTTGLCATFVEAQDPCLPRKSWQYECDFWDTLVKKFPDAERFRVEK